jgi:hypothetical protein
MTWRRVAVESVIGGCGRNLVESAREVDCLSANAELPRNFALPQTIVMTRKPDLPINVH